MRSLKGGRRAGREQWGRGSARGNTCRPSFPQHGSWQSMSTNNKGVKVKVCQLCKHYTVEFVKGDFGRNGAVKEFLMFLKKLSTLLKISRGS